MNAVHFTVRKFYYRMSCATVTQSRQVLWHLELGAFRKPLRWIYMYRNNNKFHST